MNDRVNGECARKGRTLEQHCHENEGGCKLYFTKKGTTPIKYRGFVEAANVWRTRRKTNLKMLEELMPFWAEKAYMIGDSVYEQVEAELNADAGNDEEKADFAIKSEGDSGVFKNVFEHMKQIQAKRKEVDE